MKEINSRARRVGLFVAQLRKQRNINQSELAKLTDSSRSTISDIEKGLRLPSGELLIELSRYFGMTTDAILLLDFELSNKANGKNYSVLNLDVTERQKCLLVIALSSLEVEFDNELDKEWLAHAIKLITEVEV
ncbi:MAG: hypothetical protein CML20_20510 [Rheinheimera sp.]|jgi:transcriptional regulator with XRE-family HTH domain|nr:hypothetical protein [Rheinheimera sp.]|tara:strand:- start:7859 stop:8257 length:399 start_codon:yes stop_codon:yes gene_type:complete